MPARQCLQRNNAGDLLGDACMRFFKYSFQANPCWEALVCANLIFLKDTNIVCTCQCLLAVQPPDGIVCLAPTGKGGDGTALQTASQAGRRAGGQSGAGHGTQQLPSQTQHPGNRHCLRFTVQRLVQIHHGASSTRLALFQGQTTSTLLVFYQGLQELGSF